MPNKTVSQDLEKKKRELIKKITPIAKNAFKDGVISTEDYNILTGIKTSPEESVKKLVNDPNALEKFIPKLKKRIDKRKNFLKDFKRKRDTLYLENYNLNLESNEIKNSIKEHSIFKSSNFLRDLSTNFNKRLRLKGLLEDFFKKNKQFIESDMRATLDTLIPNLKRNMYLPKKWYRKWLLKSTVIKNIKTDPQKAKDYISQLDISLNKLDDLNNWLKSSECITQRETDKLEAGIKEFEKRNKHLISSKEMSPISNGDYNTLSKNQLSDDIFMQYVENIVIILNDDSVDFTYNENIKPLIKNFKTILKESTENLFKIAKKIINTHSYNATRKGYKPWKPDW